MMFSQTIDIKLFNKVVNDSVVEALIKL